MAFITLFVEELDLILGFRGSGGTESCISKNVKRGDKRVSDYNIGYYK